MEQKKRFTPTDFRRLQGYMDKQGVVIQIIRTHKYRDDILNPVKPRKTTLYTLYINMEVYGKPSYKRETVKSRAIRYALKKHPALTEQFNIPAYLVPRNKGQRKTINS